VSDTFKVHSTIRPDEELEVDAQTYLDMKRDGLLVDADADQDVPVIGQLEPHGSNVAVVQENSAPDSADNKTDSGSGADNKTDSGSGVATEKGTKA
jgi:hypothetical protein